MTKKPLFHADPTEKLDKAIIENIEDLENCHPPYIKKSGNYIVAATIRPKAPICYVIFHGNSEELWDVIDFIEQRRKKNEL